MCIRDRVNRACDTADVAWVAVEGIEDVVWAAVEDAEDVVWAVVEDVEDAILQFLLFMLLLIL